MSIPWLIGLGHVLTYTALFSKLWRVDRVLQFTLRQPAVLIRDVMGPSLLLFILSVIILGLWTGLNPLTWERPEVNVETGASVGSCQSDYSKAYGLSIASLMLVSTVLACVMAWRTKDVDSRYAESFWIFLLVAIQVQFFLVSIPLVAILMEVSVNGRYIGSAIMFYLFPMLTLGFIMVPKFVSFYREYRGIKGPKRKRGERAKISGSAVISELGSGGIHGDGASGDIHPQWGLQRDDKNSHAEEPPSGHTTDARIGEGLAATNFASRGGGGGNSSRVKAHEPPMSTLIMTPMESGEEDEKNDRGRTTASSMMKTTDNSIPSDHSGASHAEVASRDCSVAAAAVAAGGGGGATVARATSLTTGDLGGSLDKDGNDSVNDIDSTVVTAT